MSRTVFVNGKFLSENAAKISIFDRGFLFADAVYEVTTVLGGKLIGWEGHITRLRRSLSQLGMEMPYSEKEFLAVHRQLISDNALVDGLIYLQVTRGEADRSFVFSNLDAQTVVLFSQKEELLAQERLDRELKVILVDDVRWGRRDIKTVQLLAPSLSKTLAKNSGKDDAWMVQDGFVTEGTSNNAFIVDQHGKVITRNLSNFILPGITRARILELMIENDIEFEERPFSISEAKNASEAFVTSATNFVTSVVEIDNRVIGDGVTGSRTRKLRKAYIECSLNSAI